MIPTRLPLIPAIRCRNPFDLHVLSTPPAFILSQDQTLKKDLSPSYNRIISDVRKIYEVTHITLGYSSAVRKRKKLPQGSFFTVGKNCVVSYQVIRTNAPYNEHF